MKIVINPNGNSLVVCPIKQTELLKRLLSFPEFKCHTYSKKEIEKHWGTEKDKLNFDNKYFINEDEFIAYLYIGDNQRNHPELIKGVEELNIKEWKIVEIPDDIEWEILYGNGFDVPFFGEYVTELYNEWYDCNYIEPENKNGWVEIVVSKTDNQLNVDKINNDKLKERLITTGDFNFDKRSTISKTKRTHPELVKAVRELGIEDWGIIIIPDDVKWQIKRETDKGYEREWVVEKHRIWR